jgi:hypothetical protein
MTATEWRRGYDRAFDWEYEPPVPPEPPPGPPEPPPTPQPGPWSPTITWDGMDINPGWTDEVNTLVVTEVTGWYDTPEFDGGNIARELADGSIFGPKVMQARTVVITGAAVGTRAQLWEWRDQLAMRAAHRVPAELTIGDPPTGHVLTATVRSDGDQFRHAYLGSAAFTWQVTVMAADPRLYELTWRQAVLTELGDASTGRSYARSYWWRYASTDVPNAAVLVNPGNVDAPVWALYQGDLSQSVLTDGTSVIGVSALSAGETLLVDCATLNAEEQGGASRAQMILPGSQPLLVPRRSSARWRLAATGEGSVTLAWRGAWA